MSSTGVLHPLLVLSSSSAPDRSHLKVSRPKRGKDVESGGTGTDTGDVCDTHCL